MLQDSQPSPSTNSHGSPAQGRLCVTVSFALARIQDETSASFVQISFFMGGFGSALTTKQIRYYGIS